jgi:FkbM family methyltransferase
MTMPTQAVLQKQLDKVEHLATTSKLVRLFSAPGRYFSAQAHKWLIYRYTKKGMITTASTFFGRTMHIVLPAATDIYLTGGKTHPSEIRLARYLVNNLRTGGQFLDVGAHFGYFTLLGGCLVGETGKVVSIEASPATFEVLQKNAKGLSQINIRNIAATERVEEVTFHEFPVLLSEYNSLLGGQYEQETWYKNNKPNLVKIQGKDLTTLLTEEHFSPTHIKIDVEGAEDQVVRGGLEYFKQQQPVIVMEYLADNNKNSGHKKAVGLLKDLGYRIHVLNELGEPIICTDILAHLKKTGWESDNIVFL